MADTIVLYTYVCMHAIYGRYYCVAYVCVYVCHTRQILLSISQAYSDISSRHIKGVTCDNGINYIVSLAKVSQLRHG